MKQNASLKRVGRCCKPACLISLGLLLAAPLAQAQGTAFSYQGRLSDNGSPANGNYDLTFALFSVSSGVGQLGNTITNSPTGVTNGLFSVTLDFGAGVLTGPARWLEIGARTNSGGSFATLSPRQPLTPVPYAIYATNAGTASTASGVASGSVTAAGVASGQVVKSLNGLTDAVTLSPGPNVTLATNGNKLTVSSTGGGAVFSLNGTNAYYNGGNVGIGTTTPDKALTVQAATGHHAIQWENSTFTLGYLGENGDVNSGLVALVNNGTVSVALQANGPTWLTGGNVGIGTTSPGKLLDVISGFDAGIRIAQSTSSGYGYIQFGQSATAANNFHIGSEDDGTFRLWNGNWGAGTELLRLDSTGTLQVKVLQINGADVAEPFEISSRDIPKGSLVIIDKENPGKVKLSDHAYDSCVAGILSGANGVNSGILLKQQGFNDGGQNVALSGRVYALADASYGAIQPGDLLTTSDTLGHCMKVSDHARAKGAIIGKAMSSLKEGKGMVLVLVSLQ